MLCLCKLSHGDSPARKTLFLQSHKELVSHLVLHQLGCPQPPAHRVGANQAQHPTQPLPVCRCQKKRTKQAEPLLCTQHLAHLQLLRRGGGHGDQLLQLPRLPQRIDLLVPLQDHFFSQVDPEDVSVLPLGIRQVPQDTAQALREGEGDGEGWDPCFGCPCLPWGACPSPWSWAAPSRRRASWGPVESWPHSSPWLCSSCPGRSAHLPPAAKQSLGKGDTPTLHPSLGLQGGFPAHHAQEKSPNSSNLSKTGHKDTAALQRWEMLFLQQDHAKAAASHQQLWSPSPHHSQEHPER